LQSNSLPTRFYLLDVARGIAALSVVIWHYQHFYYGPNKALPINFSRSDQPFYKIFWLFYEHGSQAIHFFFCLSGFIFFWIYLEKIRNNEVDAKSFFILRFSRLYPLHFVTLIFVAIFQFVFMEFNGNFVVFQYNDLENFFLNLFFISYWGFPHVWSFNGPVWSVSAEVFAYSVFFLFATMGLRKIWHVIIVLLLTYPFVKPNNNLAQVIFSFFVGGGTYLIFDLLVKRYLTFSKKLLFVPPLVAVILLSSLFIGTTADSTIKNYALDVFLFPCIILLCALLQMVKFDLGKNISLIGDLSYSTYLLHFPLQLILIGFSQYFGYQFRFGPIFFVLYFALLLNISFIVYKKFEVPAQKYIRHKFIS
jgi:peptidoglycan/LPS O-acetylase OafA/YrhL